MGAVGAYHFSATEGVMKRSIAMTALVLTVCAFAWAQVPTMEGASSTRYTVWSDAGKNDAAALASTLDGLFSIYNEYFRFDETQLKAPLTVRKFSRKTGFDAYLTQVLGQSKDDFVYLHYPTADRSELVIFVKESGEDYADRKSVV